TFDFSGLKSIVESLKAVMDAQNDHLVTWAKSSTNLVWSVGPRLTKIEHTQTMLQNDISSLKKDTSEIKNTMTEIFNAFKGQTLPSSSVPTTTLAVIEVDMDTKEAVKKESTKKPKNKKKKQELARASRAIPISIVRPLTRLDPELQKMRSSSIIMLTDTILEVLVRKSQTQLIGPMIDITPPPQPETHLDKEEKIKKATEEANLLEISKPELIKVVHEEALKVRIDPKILESAKGSQEFKKIQDAEIKVLSFKKKKNKNVSDLMTSLAKRYERLKKIPKELGIQSALPVPAPEQASSQLSGKKRKIMELEPKTRIPGLECNRSLPEGVPFVNNMLIEEPEYGMFFIDVFGDKAFQRMSDIHKVDVDTLLTYVVMASNISTYENQRFCLKLRKLIENYPNQEKLKPKRVKLEVVGYRLD
ncbi:hypothetical protein Tco_0228643, partial [Tanacetum coccineum]